jgi:hypothetical protein
MKIFEGAIDIAVAILAFLWPGHDCSGLRVACCRPGNRLGSADDGRCFSADLR